MEFAENPQTPDSFEKPTLPTREQLLEKIRARHKEDDLLQEKVNHFLTQSAIPPPPLFTALGEAFQTPGSGVPHYCKILEPFPALAERLLNLANHPAFLSHEPALGLPELFENHSLQGIQYLALALETVDRLMPPPGFLVSRNDFWLHGNSVGLAAHAIARLCGEDLPDLFFVTGLLNHIGRLVIANHAPDMETKAISQAQSSGRTIFETEEHLLGFNHSQVGGNLLLQWGFDEQLVQGVIHFRNPQNIRHPSQAIHILHISEIMANNLRRGHTGESAPPKLHPESVKALGLTRSTLDSTKANVLSQVHEVQAIMLP